MISIAELLAAQAASNMLASPDAKAASDAVVDEVAYPGMKVDKVPAYPSRQLVLDAGRYYVDGTKSVA